MPLAMHSDSRTRVEHKPPESKKSETQKALGYLARQCHLAETRSSSDFHEPIRLFRIFHLGQDFLRLTMDAVHQLLIGIGDLVTVENGFSQSAQYASRDRTKPQPGNKQGSRLPDDFVLEDKTLWLDRVFGEIRFQLQKRIEPVAVTGKYGRFFMQHDESGFFLCQHVFEFPVIIQQGKDREVTDLCHKDYPIDREGQPHTCYFP